MNTDTEHNINATVYIRISSDTSVNNHAYLHFCAGINSTQYSYTNGFCYILTMILILLLMHLQATIHIFATMCFEDRNLISL